MNLFENLNSEQLQAVTCKDGPLLIVAGAGTGKTTVITKRIAWLIDQKLAKSDEILALTFTEKSSGEMQERIDKLLPYGYVDLWVHTFHSFCQRILESYGIEIGLPTNFKLLDTTQQWILIYNNFSKFTLDYYRPMGNPTKFLHSLIRHFSRLKDEAITAKDYLEYAQNLRLNMDSPDFVKNIISAQEMENLSKKEVEEMGLQEIKKIDEVANAYHTYQEMLLQNNALDFGDLINYCLKLFKERPKILAKFRTQFKNILVDEFQDTNWAQYELVKILSMPKNNLTVCGDDDQSIYKFRGASISNILQFKKDFPTSSQVYLVKNYRSKQNILDLAYNFIQHNNPNRLEATLKKEKSISKKLIAENQGDGTIDYLELENAEFEMRAVVNKIIDLKEKDQKVLWSDFAILVRANSQADIFNYGLTQAKVPYQYVASRGLYNKGIVLDILAWMKLLDNYHESTALFRILSIPIFGFIQKELIHFNYWSRRKGKSLYSIISHTSILEGISEETIKKINVVTGLIERHSRTMYGKSIKQIVLEFLEESGYLANITKVESVETRQTISYLNQFYKKISEFEINTSHSSVKNFLEIIELEIQAGEEGQLLFEPELEGPESVKIMTIHAAKGLEFKYVFVVNMVDRRFPTTERREQIEIPDALVKEIIPSGDIHLEEERRLFYVAVTRAKEGIWFTGALDYGGARKKKPSIFMFESGLEPQKASSKMQDLSKAHAEPEKGKKENHKLPEKFSFSQLKAYENCPWQYRYAFILRVPVKGKAVFSFGKTVHLCMQKLYERIQSKQESLQTDLFGIQTGQVSSIKKVSEYVKLDDLIKLYDECFIDDWYKDEKEREDYYEKGKKILKAYYKDIENEIIRPKFLEKGFSIKIPDNKKGLEYSLYGVIDRVDEKDGGFEIIDYKTGHAKKELKSDDREQLLIYQLAGQEIFDKPVKNLTFHYIEENIKQTFLGEAKDLDKLKEKIVSAIHEIEKGEFKPNPGMICQFCDFKDICEYRKL